MKGSVIEDIKKAQKVIHKATVKQIKLIKGGNTMKGLNIGEIVILNSGGPYMTVESISKRATVCSWDDNGTVKRHKFPSACLTKKVDESDA